MLDVLVVGGGPVGLFFATLLKKSTPQCSVRVIDKEHDISELSRAPGMHARTLECISYLGSDLLSKFLEKGKQITGLDVFCDNKRILGIDIKDIRSPFNFVLSIPQNETETLMQEECKKLGVQVDRGVCLEQLKQEQDSVYVSLKHVQDNVTETVRARFLVGCDGGHSLVRKALGIEFIGTSRSEVFYMADAKVEEFGSLNRSQLYFSERGPCFFIPLSKDMIRVVLEGSEDAQLGVSKYEDSHVNSETLETFQRHLTEGFGTPLTLSNPTWITSFKVNQKMAAKYFVPNGCLLIGDAAHVHSPVGGQGMNMGMQDAFNLAWKMSLVLMNQGNPRTLFESFEIERQQIARQILSSTGKATELLLGHGFASRMIRSKFFTSSISFLESWIPKRMIAERMSQIRLSYDPQLSPLFLSEPKSCLTRWKNRLSFNAFYEGQRAPCKGRIKSLDSGETKTLLSMYSQSFAFLFLILPANRNEALFLSQSLVPIKRFGCKTCIEIIWKNESQVKLEGSPHRQWIDMDNSFPPGPCRLIVVRPDGYIASSGSESDTARVIAFLDEWLSV